MPMPIDAEPEKGGPCAPTRSPCAGRSALRPGPREISAYISIPFCPSRCSYCSFISQAGEKMLALLPDYLERLCGEIRLYGDALRGSGLALRRSVYVGGGTPAVLSAVQIRTLLQTARRALPMDSVQEFTFEAGRPDAVDAEKLRVLREYGVDRVSVNPQTLHDATLARIGRRPTAAQFYAAYEQAARLGFRCINTDLILGLPGESEDEMLESVNGILALSPQNVTLHALCLKKVRPAQNGGRDAACPRPGRSQRRGAGAGAPAGTGATVPTISTGRKMRSAAWKTRAIPSPAAPATIW